ncbi:MAG: PatB family C-S lyase [Opitutaceae bacterium]
MKYDFESVVDRSHSDSQKWQRYRGRDILPMWVADMDFKCAPEIQEALAARLSEGVFGYAGPTPSTIEAAVEAMDRKFEWAIQPEWLVWLPGLVRGLNLACRAVGQPGDSVLTMTPVYGPFLTSPLHADRKRIDVPVLKAGDAWQIDWEALEAAVDTRTRLLLLCNPHNPIGRVYRRNELERLADFSLRHDLIVCSDEIHCELILDPLEHIPWPTLSSGIAERSITLISPSKTFNTAGLACGLAVIPDPRLRSAFKRAGAGILAEVSCFGFTCFEAAWRKGEPWRLALLDHLRANRDRLLDFVRRELPGVTANPIEATYLAWLDISPLGLRNPVTHFESHGIGLSGGREFGGADQVRLNFACPTTTLEQGLQRLKNGVEAARTGSLSSR